MADLLEFYPPSAFDAEGRELPEHTWVEPKLDGVRALVHVVDGEVIITSKRRNKDGVFNRLQDTVPHLRAHPAFKRLRGYSIFDGELVAGGTKSNSFGATMSVVGANPDKAVALQEQRGPVRLHLFDCLRLGNEDFTDKAQTNRRLWLNCMLDGMEDAVLDIVPRYYAETMDQRLKLFEALVSDGYEGLVIKHPLCTYFQKGAWAKLKAQTTVDALVTGFKLGNGKYANTLGALNVAVIDAAAPPGVPWEETLVEVANVAPGTDAERARMFALLAGKTREEVVQLGLVVELEGQGWSPHNRIRHPRVKRYRPDRNLPNEVDFTTVVRV